jgi:uncharacterized protein YbjT (DUF2867 family)
MSQVLVVFGATGQQGGSIIDYVRNDPELSAQYTIRAITRDIDSTKAKQLKEKNIEVVQSDVLDRASLEMALTGAHTIFSMTTRPSGPNPFGPESMDAEFNSAKTIADVAIQKGAQYIIYSTLPSLQKISGGEFTISTPFDVKHEAEQYIRSLPIKSAFYCPGGFMENFHNQPFSAPQKAPDGTWVLSRTASPDCRIPWVSVAADTGKFVGAILADPDRYEGKTFCAAAALYTMDDLVTSISKATGKNVVYQQISLEDFRQRLPPGAEAFADGYRCMEKFGYYGSDAENLVAWAIENARGRLTTFEEYLMTHPLQLQ